MEATILADAAVITTVSEMTYNVLSGTLNHTQPTKPETSWGCVELERYGPDVVLLTQNELNTKVLLSQRKRTTLCFILKCSIFIKDTESWPV